MSDGSDEGRRFSDDEVRAIIERASERSSVEKVRHPRGLSLAELKDIGSEVGIDPGRLEEAARHVARGRRDGFIDLITGASRSLAVHRRLPGAFDPTDAPEVLAAIRGGLDAQSGEVKEVHGSLEWSETGEFYQRHVTISSSEGVTTIRGTSSLTNAMIMVFAGAGAATALGTILPTIVLEELFNTGGLPLVLVPPFLFPVVFMLARLILKNIADVEADRLEEVADRLESFAKPREAEPEEG